MDSDSQNSLLRVPSASSPPVVLRARDNSHTTTNVSSGLMRPLYTSCAETQNAQEQPRVQEQQQASQRTTHELPRKPTQSPPATPARTLSQAGQHASPFLRLPVELRLQIYSLLVLPRRATDLLPAYEKVHASTQDYFDYDKKQHGTDHPATADLAHPHLLIRTIDPDRYRKRYPETSPTPIRAKYSVRCDRFRSACKRTTYHCVNNPRFATQLMTVNRTIHAEAAELLYGSYTFDFDTHVEAIVPFLSDLTPFTRSCIKSVRLVKRALAYEKGFDRCEWSNALRYLTSPSTGASLRKLELGVVAGRPGADGWDGVPVYDKHDMELLSGLEGYEWMRYLLAFRGLQELDVQPVVEHCAPGGTSRALAGYIRFSASVETGFQEFLREQLLGA